MYRTRVLIAAILATLMVGCSNTTGDKNIDYSGFLGDYAMLEKGGSGQAERRYVRPDTDWASYGKVLTPSHFTSWGTVEDMMGLWASHGSYNLCMLQKRTSCQEPQS